MIKKHFLFPFFIIALLTSCSFDNKTSIWQGGKKERERINELRKRQNEIINVQKIYSTENIYSEEIALARKIDLSDPKKNKSWKMSALNHQNSLGNLYVTGVDKVFFKKKIGKNKFDLSKFITTPILYKNNILMSDDRGSIYKVDFNGKLKWKKNIYKKIYKKIYKNLTFYVNENDIYIADNVGFIYCLDFNNGDLKWIRNHGIPLKSNIKFFDDKIFLINQDNRFLSLNAKDGSLIWDLRSISSFIKIQNFLSIAVSKVGNVVFVTSSGDIFKVNADDGKIFWSANISGALYAHGTDFFKSSEIVIVDDEVIFSTGTSIFSFNLESGYMNWEKSISSSSTPIIDKNNIFLVTENGFFVILDKDTGKVISSNNILKILKEKKRETKITGFILGSGKIYTTTLNGYLIISSASTGKTENYTKIGDNVLTPPIINDGKLFVLTSNSKIIGFN